MGTKKPVKNEAAVCGLFCESCSAYIGTKEDPERLEELAGRFNVPVEEVECEGCRSNKRLGYCDDCVMFKCANQKGLDFCGECEDYPCEELGQFQTVLPHRIELWKSLERIKEAGWEKWYEEMLDHYGCPECGAINSAYDPICRKCGSLPSCKYVEENHLEIAERLSNMKKMIRQMREG